jgi:hypothetical protein
MLSPHIIAAVYGAVAIAGVAASFPISSKSATHRVRTVGRDVKVEVFHPKTTYQVSWYTQFLSH